MSSLVYDQVWLNNVSAIYDSASIASARIILTMTVLLLSSLIATPTCFIRTWCTPKCDQLQYQRRADNFRRKGVVLGTGQQSARKQLPATTGASRKNIPSQKIPM